MKIAQYWLIIVGLVSGLALGTAFSKAEATQARFDDPAVERAVHFQRQQRPAEEMTVLTIYEAVRSLAGIEQLPHLETLVLKNSKGASLKPLRALSNLRTLTIEGGSGIGNPEALGCLDSVTSLTLTNLGLEDIGFLEALPHLEALDLSQNRIIDLSPLSSLANLRFLQLSSNRVSDTTALAELNKLRVLQLSKNHLAAAAALEELQSLTHLSLDGNRLQCASFLGRLSGLRFLDLSFNAITDIGCVPVPPDLQSLRLWGMCIDGVTDLPGRLAFDAVLDVVEEHTYQDYTLRVYSDEFALAGCFELLHRGTTVFYQPGLRFAFGQLAAHAPWSDDSAAELPIGADITGNAVPNLIVRESAGGARDRKTVYVFELGEPTRLLGALDAGYAVGEPFADITGDGSFEFVTNDWTFSYWRTDFATSPAPTVILRFDGAGYRLAAELMETRAPSSEELSKAAAAMTVRIEQEEPFWEPLLELIYTGNAPTAWQLLDRAWPPDLDGRTEFQAALAAKLLQSPYLEGLQQLNQGRLFPCLHNRH